MDLTDLNRAGMRALAKSLSDRINTIADQLPEGETGAIPGSVLELAVADAREAQTNADIQARGG